MQRTLDRLPNSLRAYCIEHDASKYSARDHAAWRYIMRRSHTFFKDHAVSTYQDGFRRSGLRIDRIPHIDEIDRALQEFGWGAVPVVGFIAPWAFIEFQSRKILPIAADMRSVDHIAYTPAPDIVHEAAGHAPILPDKDYSDYLAYYASLGTKAIYSKQDLRLYEAVRYLSDIKEKPESTPAMIAVAEQRLQDTLSASTYVSEQVLVARMSWWTAEYGLAGSLKNPKIYGAGLLSSVGESKLAITDKVKKIPFSIDCINYSYNITEPQPQLFVAENMQHLHDVLHQLDGRLAYRIGGISSLQKAIECEAVTSTVLDTGITISGRLDSFQAQGDRIDFIKYAGPVQISRDGKQLIGQGAERHSHGFSSPLGRLDGHSNKAFSDLDERECEALGLKPDHSVHLRFISGIELKGRVLSLLREEKKLLMITFGDCTVKRVSTLYFDPAWGEFDMVLGDFIPSVYGGPADREAYGEREITEATTTPARETPYTPKELATFSLYQRLATLRSDLAQEPNKERQQSILDLAKLWQDQANDEWLLALEIDELASKYLVGSDTNHPSLLALQQKLQDPKKWPQDIQDLIQEGLQIIGASHLA